MMEGEEPQSMLALWDLMSVAAALQRWEATRKHHEGISVTCQPSQADPWLQWALGT